MIKKKKNNLIRNIFLMIIVQGLWIGGSLSILERLSISSFLKNGYEYHLYTYEEVKNSPDGAIIKDGNEILPQSEIFTYKNGSVSAFSNLFRFMLLYKKGGWWVDTDLMCTQYYDDSQDKYIFVSQPTIDYTDFRVTSYLIKADKGDSIMLEGYRKCLAAKKKILKGIIKWDLGPLTVGRLVKKHKLQKFMKPWYFANSCNCHHYKTIISPNHIPNIKKKKKDQLVYFSNLNDKPKDNYFIHFWHEYWRKKKIDKNKKFNKDSIFEQLKDIYLF